MITSNNLATCLRDLVTSIRFTPLGVGALRNISAADAMLAEFDKQPDAAPRRMWVNQPSTLQPLHAWHGLNVIAVPDFGGGHRCYPLAGDVISFHAPKGCMSEGWNA